MMNEWSFDSMNGFIMFILCLIASLSVIGFGIYTLIFYLIGMIGLTGLGRIISSVGFTLLSMLCLISLFKFNIEICEYGR